MHYKIVAVHAKYNDYLLVEVAVVWVSNEKENRIRSSYCQTFFCSGYKYLHEFNEDRLSEDLIQEVAGQGMNLPDDKKKEYFPQYKKWER
jgi:hypothetical protein